MNLFKQIINRIKARVVSKKMKSSLDRVFHKHYRVGYFVLDNVPAEVIDYINSDLLVKFLVNNDKEFKKFSSYFNEEILKRVIEYHPQFILYIERPSLEIQEISMKGLDYSIISIFLIDKPHDDIIIKYLKKYWQNTLYKRIKNMYGISENLNKKINRLKLKKGPMVEVSEYDEFLLDIELMDTTRL